jgi:hypothetical protein
MTKAKTAKTSKKTAKTSESSGAQKTRKAAGSQNKKPEAPQMHTFLDKASLEELIDFYKKNMELMKDRQQTVVDLFKRVMQLNNSYMRHSFDDLLNYSGQVLQGTHKSADQKAEFEQLFERSMAHGRSVSELFVHTTKKVLESYRNTFEDNWRSAQSFFKH